MPKTNILSAFIAISRMPFLVLGPIIVLLGISSAHASTGTWNIQRSILLIIAAIAAHIAVNAFNEYSDFRSGLDNKTNRTPFSGGSGWLPKHPDHEAVALKIGIIALAIMTVLGLYLSLTGAPWLLLLGIIGAMIIISYTPWINHSAWLCLIAPGMGFGLLMVNGTHYAITTEFSSTALLLSVTVFFLINNLLLLNQFPDQQADRESGRKHAVVKWGKAISAKIFSAFLVFAYIPLLLAWYKGLLPLASTIALLFLPLAIVIARGVIANQNNTQALQRYMGMNVLLVNLLPLTLALTLLL